MANSNSDPTDRDRRASPPPREPLPAIQADRIARAVATAWHGVDSDGRLDIPLSMLATLAAVPRTDAKGNENAPVIAGWGPADLALFTRIVWTDILTARPETVHLLYPLIGWIFAEDNTEPFAAAHTVARAAIRSGQLDLTGTDRRFRVDLLGITLAALRPRAGWKARGQFYTPADIASVLAQALHVEEHRSVTDPTMGTGAMFRAVAEAMRDKGRDPRTIRWIGCDNDALAVACATVNSMMWAIGNDIVFYVGDTFTKDWESIALKQREQLRKLAADISRYRPLLAFIKNI